MKAGILFEKLTLEEIVRGRVTQEGKKADYKDDLPTWLSPNGLSEKLQKEIQKLSIWEGKKAPSPIGHG